jgi:hypothetical protein
MNKLEKAIMRAVKDAQQFYVDVAGGWLFEASESFLQHHMALSLIRRTNHCVLAEISPKKIADEFQQKGPKVKSKKRFDLVIWPKVATGVRAVVEIKRAFHIPGVMKDAVKIEKYRKLKFSSGLGYLVVYTEVSNSRQRRRGKDRKRALCGRLKKWGKHLRERGWRTVDTFVISPRDCEDYRGRKWSWGVALYRFDARA